MEKDNNKLDYKVIKKWGSATNLYNSYRVFAISTLVIWYDVAENSPKVI